MCCKRKLDRFYARFGDEIAHGIGEINQFGGVGRFNLNDLAEDLVLGACRKSPGEVPFNTLIRPASTAVIAGVLSECKLFPRGAP